MCVNCGFGQVVKCDHNLVLQTHLTYNFRPSWNNKDETCGQVSICTKCDMCIMVQNPPTVHEFKYDDRGKATCSKCGYLSVLICQKGVHQMQSKPSTEGYRFVTKDDKTCGIPQECTNCGYENELCNVPHRIKDNKCLDCGYIKVCNHVLVSDSRLHPTSICALVEKCTLCEFIKVGDSLPKHEMYRQKCKRCGFSKPDCQSDNKIQELLLASNDIYMAFHHTFVDGKCNKCGCLCSHVDGVTPKNKDGPYAYTVCVKNPDSCCMHSDCNTCGASDIEIYEYPHSFANKNTCVGCGVTKPPHIRQHELLGATQADLINQVGVLFDELRAELSLKANQRPPMELVD